MVLPRDNPPPNPGGPINAGNNQNANQGSSSGSNLSSRPSAINNLNLLESIDNPSRPSAINNSIGGLLNSSGNITMRRSEPTILKDDNFGIWKWSLKYNLKSQSLYECLVNPSTATQEQLDATMFEIISTISDKIKIRVAHCKGPKELYQAIEALYSNKTSFQITDLHMKLSTFKFKSSEHISEGLSHVQGIVAKLKNLDEKVSDHMIEGVILSALPSSFRTFITVWKGLNSNERTLNNLMNRLMAEVEDNKIFNCNTGKAMLAKNGFKKSFANKSGNSSGKPLDKSKITCYNCNKKGLLNYIST